MDEEKFFQWIDRKMKSIPSKYIPEGLSKSDKEKQIKSIRLQTDRPKVNYPKRKSKWTAMAHRYFGKAPSLDEIAKELKVPMKALQEIISKGEGAYFSSGSRPNQTKESWSLARLYAVIFGSKKARKVDKHIIDKYNIPILRVKEPTQSDPSPPKDMIGSGMEVEVEKILKEKEYPLNYSKELNSIVEMISFTPKTKKPSVEILGSFSIRSQVWASDIDLMETVNMSSLSVLKDRYQDIIRNLLKHSSKSPPIFIGDIKLGNITEWRILDDRAYFVDGKLLHYNAEQSKIKLKDLYDKKIIDKSFYDKGMSLLVDNPTAKELRIIIKELRPNIQRWKTSEILKGYKMLPTNKKYTIEEAMSSPGVFKMDIIALLSDGIFQEMGIVYDLRVKGRRINDFHYDVQESLIQDIQFYSSIGNWFKVLKRIFSLSNYRYRNVSKDKEKQIEIIEKIFPIMISDLGILYQVHGDINSLIMLLENSDISLLKIKKEIDEFINRLSNVYSVDEYVSKDVEIMKRLRGLLEVKSKEKIISELKEIDEMIEKALNSETRKRMNDLSI
jgi:hypothetical protein